MKELGEIVEEYLRSNSYDGLFKPGECACSVDKLMPCGQPYDNCEAGYKSAAENSDYDFMIGPLPDAESEGE